MQSWVYLTLPQVKQTQEPVNQLPRNLQILPLLGGKKKKVHFPILSCSPLCPTEFSGESEVS